MPSQSPEDMCVIPLACSSNAKLRLVKENSGMLPGNDQLNWFVSLLRKYDIIYWLDSGSLLGLIREGKLLDYDSDIDIGIISGQENAVHRMLFNSTKEGYRCKKYTYDGRLFKYKLTLARRKGYRTIDINVFNKQEEYLWCPQVKSIHSIRKMKLLLVPFLKCVEVLRMTSDYDRFPLSVRGMYTWWIPVDLVQPTIEYGEFGVSIPKNYEAYLQYRYGNWRIPNRNWSFWNDDGGLNKARPEELVDLPTKRRSKR